MFITQNIEGLKRDVLDALSTTEEYANDFAQRVTDYFENRWIPLHPNDLPSTVSSVRMPGILIQY